MADYKGNFYSDAYGNHVKRFDVEFFTASSCDKVIVEPAQATAGSAIITFGQEFSSMEISSRPVIISVTRGGIDMHSFKVTVADDSIKVENNGTDFVLTAGDVITYIIM